MTDTGKPIYAPFCLSQLFRDCAQNPKARDLFRMLKENVPYYRDKDLPEVARYKARGGRDAPPGSVTLRQHDLLHFLLGVNLTYWDEDHRKDGERFLTGFTYGACPAFTQSPSWKERFLHNVRTAFPDEYQVKGRGYDMLELGYILGQRWQDKTGIDLQAFLETAIHRNFTLQETLAAFYHYSEDFHNEMTESVTGALNEIRFGIAESFDTRFVLSYR